MAQPLQQDLGDDVSMVPSLACGAAAVLALALVALVVVRSQRRRKGTTTTSSARGGAHLKEGEATTTTKAPRSVSDDDVAVALAATRPPDAQPPSTPVLILFATTGGRARQYAERLARQVEGPRCGRQAVVTDLGGEDASDPWDALLNSNEYFDVALVASTAEQGRAPLTSRRLLETALDDLVHDFRVGATGLRGRRFAVLGLGSSAYESFCGAAKNAERKLRRLGASRVASLMLDDAVDGEEDAYDAWETRVLNAFRNTSPWKAPSATSMASSSSSRQQQQPRNKPRASSRGRPLHSRREPDDDQRRRSDDEDEDDEGDEEEDDPQKDDGVVDVEDVGATFSQGSQDREKTSGTSSKGEKEMVTAKQAKALKKEGYKLIGSHSAVKLCRWTKHQLRGRGGCYKHTFYGITSYQCMEATPSLACANKCVFCWRHHKNPVGREWRWKTDDPVRIVEDAVALHRGMINEFKGVPGVVEERWRDAMTVRHCALSLVGEPIMYPRINELVGELHRREISTFLVTNGQFPDAIDTLVPVTQLYVSVDAGDETALVKVDRPLFSDAWARLQRSLELLKLKKQRTVARLTIVKGYNADDVDGYAQLLALGVPTLIEIKGVTFCGKSDASDLTMESCPWHHEIVALGTKLCDKLNHRLLFLAAAAQNNSNTVSEESDYSEASSPSSPAATQSAGRPVKRVHTPPRYGLACSHAHSVSVVLAREDQLLRDGRWFTWIDYDEFHRLVRAGKPFDVADYAAPTPAWALHGAAEEGFDPTDTRLYKKKANGKSR